MMVCIVDTWSSNRVSQRENRTEKKDHMSFFL